MLFKIINTKGDNLSFIRFSAFFWKKNVALIFHNFFVFQPIFLKLSMIKVHTVIDFFVS